jgi:DNA-binding XRE family transcriptional regulator
VCATLPFYERVLEVPRDKYLPASNRGNPVPKNPTTLGGHLRKRRLQLGLFQSVAALRLWVSTVTLSKWERDVLYPAWSNQPKVTDYLGFNPFTDPALGRPLGNERVPVMLLSAYGYQLRQRRLAMRLSRKTLAEQLGISWKTIWGWENNRRNPSPKLKARLEQLLNIGAGKVA